MYDELIKQLRGCVDSLCGECPYKNEKTERGNFVPCMNKLLSKAADALENVPKWIPVSEQLPPINEDVLVFTYGSMIRVWMLEKQYPDSADVCWECEDGYWEDVSVATHWMPLPQKPKDGET